MSKGGENQAYNNENAALQNQNQLTNELAQLSQEYGDQYNSMVVPLLQQIYPELISTVQGGSTPLTEAAQAPVQSATNSAINTALQQQGGLVNPDALYKDIATSGQQQSALASDATINSALTALQNLFSGQQSLASSGLSGTNAAASQSGNIAGAYGNEAQQLNPASDIAALVAAGAQAYGASQGAPTGGRASNKSPQSAPVQTSVNTVAPQSASTGSSASPLQQAYDSISSMPYQPTASTPISQTSKPQSTQPNNLSLSYLPAFG